MIDLNWHILYPQKQEADGHDGMRTQRNGTKESLAELTIFVAPAKPACR